MRINGSDDPSEGKRPGKLFTRGDDEALWKEVILRSSAASSVLHGPSHWRRVAENGVAIAAANGANLNVVRLFALFHDSQRIQEGADDGHGQRAADFLTKVRGDLIHLPDTEFELLHYACAFHTHSPPHSDPTIGACWDADRLDLERVGMIPLARFMSTDPGRNMAKAIAQKYPWLKD